MESSLRRIAGVGLCLFVTVALASIATRTPWWDEGVYADPAVSLMTHGRLGSTVLGEQNAYYTPGVHEYTYWIPPFYPVGLAGFFKIFGVSVFSMRGYSFLFASIALGAWYCIGSFLGGSRTVGLLASAVLGLDYAFLQLSANGRPDAMVLGCGSGGLAAYLLLRERKLTWALVAGWSICALALYTHPSGAIFAFDLLLLIALLDLRRLRPVHAIWALLPFVIIGMIYLGYILQAPEIFRAQFGNQIRARTGVPGSRVIATITDIYYRYLAYYYLGLNGYLRVKVICLLFYITAFTGVLLTPQLRARPGVRAALTLAGANYVLLANLDRQHFPHYLAIEFAPLALVGAIWIYDLFEKRSALRLLAAGLAIISCGVSVLGHGAKSFANGYKTEFLPVLARVKPITDRGGIVVAGSEFAFGVGFRSNLIDDIRLGANLPHLPELIVLDLYGLPDSKLAVTATHAGYQMVINNRNFVVYEPKSPLALLPPHSND